MKMDGQSGMSRVAKWESGRGSKCAYGISEGVLNPDGGVGGETRGLCWGVDIVDVVVAYRMVRSETMMSLKVVDVE